MITTVSIGDSSHATVQENVQASGRQEYEDDVDGIIDITSRIRDLISLRIPYLLEMQVQQVSSMIPADVTNMRC